MKTIDWVVGKIENYVCVATFLIMLTLAFANSAARYLSPYFIQYFGFSISLSFSDEIVTNLFVLASLAGSAVAIREHAHLGLDFVTSYMPIKVRKVLFIVANLLGIAFCLFLVREGYYSALNQYQFGQVSATMQWPEWIYGATVPVGGAMLTIRFAITIIKAFMGDWSAITGHKPDSGQPSVPERAMP